MILLKLLIQLYIYQYTLQKLQIEKKGRLKKKNSPVCSARAVSAMAFAFIPSLLHIYLSLQGWLEGSDYMKLNEQNGHSKQSKVPEDIIWQL